MHTNNINTRIIFIHFFNLWVKKLTRNFQLIEFLTQLPLLSLTWLLCKDLFCLLEALTPKVNMVAQAVNCHLLIEIDTIMDSAQSLCLLPHYYRSLIVYRVYLKMSVVRIEYCI